MKRVAFTALLLLSSCTTQVREFNFSIRPIDPPIQPIENIQCFELGYDSLACRDGGMRI